MRTKPFGTLGTPLAVIGHGTWQAERDRPARVIEAIHRAIELGMTHIDTAEMYGNGRVEKLVAEALQGQRERVFLASKVLPSNASAAGTIQACEASLSRLGTDHLDLYMLHWRGRHPLEETFGAFERLRDQGKIRAWGVSNFDVDDLNEALAIVGEGQIACNQVLYHLQNRTVEHGVVPWCEQHGVSMVAYSPLGSGSFPSSDSAGGRVLVEVARAHGVSAQAIALAFLARGATSFAIPKSSQAEHVEANAAAGDILLSAAEVERISAAFPVGPWRGLPSL